MKYRTAGKNMRASDDKTVHLMSSFLQRIDTLTKFRGEKRKILSNKIELGENPNLVLTDWCAFILVFHKLFFQFTPSIIKILCNIALTTHLN